MPWRSLRRQTYVCMILCIPCTRPTHCVESTTRLYIQWRRTIWQLLIRGLVVLWGLISWTMITVIVSYPLAMDDSLADPHQSAESRKRKVHDHAGVPNVVALHIQGGHAEILAPISILIMQGMWSQWRIYWMLHGYRVVCRRSLQLNFSFSLRRDWPFSVWVNDVSVALLLCVRSCQCMGICHPYLCIWYGCRP